MLFTLSPILSVFVALSAVVLEASAKFDLSLSLTGPDIVHDVQNFRLIATLVNTGDEPLKLLNDPHGPLSIIPAHTFDIIGADGAIPMFIGIMVKYDTERIVALNDSNYFTFLAPGQKATVVHDLSTAYDFTQSGAGKYFVKAFNTFHHVDASSTLTPIFATDNGSAHIVSVSGALQFKLPPATKSKRAQYQGCTLDQQRIVDGAISQAKTYMRDGYRDLSNSEGTSTKRYIAWFGHFDNNISKTAISNMQSMDAADINALSYDCGTCPDVLKSTYVYYQLTDRKTIYICKLFYDAVQRGPSSQGGALVYITSLLYANTVPLARDQQTCRDLADKSPGVAVTNANSYQYYVENDPILYGR